MLRDEVCVRGAEAMDWAWSATGSALEWSEVDKKLRGIAKRRSALDAEEARWLREAERLQIWKPLGMVNMIDYLERVLGYAPRTAQQRLQVARALAHLPVMTEALAKGRLPFSGVRELVRVATPATEAEWCDHVSDMNLRQIEEAVAGHRPGDLPSDPPDDTAREHVVTLRLNASAFAAYRQRRLQLDEEHGHRLEDSELVAAMCAVSRTDGDGEVSGRAKFQIAMTVCPRCERGWQDGAGVRVAVDAATVERARCDAQHIGSLDGDEPERAHQDVPPSVVRFVWRRDQDRCQTPGCRSALGLEIHHIVHRERGGTHEPKNLTLRCSSCHAAHHERRLEITGEAPDRIVTIRKNAPARKAERAHVGADVPGPSDEHAQGGPIQPERAVVPSSFDAAVLGTQARDALVGLGWKPGIASSSIDEARAHVGATASLEELIREALRRCPKGHVQTYLHDG